MLLFGLLWTLCFVRHVQHAAISGALSAWYFGQQDLGCLGALGRVLSKHAGTVAFGSLLIALLQVGAAHKWRCFYPSGCRLAAACCCCERC